MTGLERLASSVLCVGFPGDAPDAAVLAELRELVPGGVILFGRNVSTPERTRGLVDAVGAALGNAPPPIVAIDQEGGRVMRLRRGTTASPSAMAVTAAGDPVLAERLGRAMAGDLRRIGVNLNFAPVLDLALEPASTVIGTRAYSDSAARAAEFGTAMLRGLQGGGVGATLKHFPGHGATATDSHAGLPIVGAALATLRARELVPFCAGIAAGVRAVMAGHIIATALDPDLPASLSPRVLTGLLRDELGFDGLIVTDCLQMDAIARSVGTARGAVLALAAGADGLTISHDLAVARAARDAIVAAVERGEVPRARLEAASAAMLRFRSAAAGATATDTPAPDGEIAGMIAQRAVTLVRGRIALRSDVPLNVVSFEGGAGDGIAALAAERPELHLALRRRRFRSDSLRVALEPSGEMIENLLGLIQAQAGRGLVIVMRRAHLHAAQRRAIDALLAAAPDAILISANEPFDVPCFTKARTVLCTYGDEEIMLEALADVLAGTIEASGRLPVTLGDVKI